MAASIRLGTDWHSAARVPDPRRAGEVRPGEADAPLRLTVRRPDVRSRIVEVAGEVDLATAPALEELVVSCLRGGVTQLVIDLSRVEFLAAAGLNVLVRARSCARHRGARLRIATGGSRAVLRALAAGRLDCALPVSERVTVAPDAAYWTTPYPGPGWFTCDFPGDGTANGTSGRHR